MIEIKRAADHWDEGRGLIMEACMDRDEESC
jgi:hypothetical protein